MILRYARHQLVLDYLRCGWHIITSAELGYHSQWAVLMQCLCDCRCVEPTLAARRMPPAATEAAAMSCFATGIATGLVTMRWYLG
jgi:hypothetical protein